MKSSRFLANPLLAFSLALPALIIGCSGETPSAPSPTYTITATAGAHGSISPAGDYQVRLGGTLTYKFTPESGYKVDVLTVDGAVVANPGTSYTFSNLSAPHTIHVTFKLLVENLLLNLNPSMETASTTDATQPAHWLQGGWGAGTPTFTWLSTDAHTGTHSLQLQVTGLVAGGGDRKWYFEDIPVTPGSSYTYSDWYKADVATNVTVRLTREDSTVTYLDLGNVASAAEWTACSKDFTVPADGSPVVSLTVFHCLIQSGTLTTDDVSILPKL